MRVGTFCTFVQLSLCFCCLSGCGGCGSSFCSEAALDCCRVDVLCGDFLLSCACCCLSGGFLLSCACCCLCGCCGGDGCLSGCGGCGSSFCPEATLGFCGVDVVYALLSSLLFGDVLVFFCLGVGDFLLSCACCCLSGGFLLSCACACCCLSCCGFACASLIDGLFFKSRFCDGECLSCCGFACASLIDGLF